MVKLENKKVLVIGLGLSGRAAAELLRRRGAEVVVVDELNNLSLQKQAGDLRTLGVRVELGVLRPPVDSFDLAVVSPGVPLAGPLMAAIRERGIRIIGELELAYQQAYCLNISITGTNGKTTTTELINRLLNHAGRRSMAGGNIGMPFSQIVDETRGLDFVTLEVSSFQLESIEFFRPSVAVLMNITPDHLDRYADMEAYIRTKANIFKNQLPFDWAVVQSEALAKLNSVGFHIPSKVITFSSQDRKADIFFDRGLLLSQMPEWPGLLLDMNQSQLIGPHNAENLMASLAIGRILRIPIETALEALLSYQPASHRCEPVAEINGVRYINDSKATNLDAVQKALLSMPGRGGSPNVFLIAGGRDKGFEYHDVGPLLSQKVKRAFLIGETQEKIRAAWSLFTPCTLLNSLLEAVEEAAKQAVPGDVVLLSPACASFDQFHNYQHRGDVFRAAVEQVRQSARTPAEICSDSLSSDHRSQTILDGGNN